MQVTRIDVILRYLIKGVDDFGECFLAAFDLGGARVDLFRQGGVAGHDLGKGSERECDRCIDFVRYDLTHFLHAPTHVKCPGIFLVGEFDLNCTSSEHMAPFEPFSKRHFSARTFSSLAC
jgi:hypothetical protein